MKISFSRGYVADCFLAGSSFLESPQADHSQEIVQQQIVIFFIFDAHIWKWCRCSHLTLRKKAYFIKCLALSLVDRQTESISAASFSKASHKAQFPGCCVFRTCSLSSPRLGISCIWLYETYSFSVPSGSSGIWFSPFCWHSILVRLWRHWQVGGQMLVAHTERLSEARVKAASMIAWKQTWSIREYCSVFYTRNDSF